MSFYISFEIPANIVNKARYVDFNETFKAIH